MPSTIVLYDQLGPGAEPGGTWIALDGGPTAPSPYDAVIDFDGFPNAKYTYEYTVVDGPITSTAQVTVDWQGDLPDRVNDECETAFQIPIMGYPHEIIIEDDLGGECGILSDPKYPSGYPFVTYPSGWTQGTYTGDLWYRAIAPSFTLGYTYEILVSGIEYEEDGVKGPAMQVFTNSIGGDCDSDVEELVIDSNLTDQQVAGFLDIPASTAVQVRFRIAAITAGLYQIKVKTQCPQ